MDAMTVDVDGLVADGLLDLDAVFERAEWHVADDIATYTARLFGRHGDEPGEISVVLESAQRYGITAYRWAERDDGSGTYETGPVTLSRAEAEEGGAEYAAENDDPPDVDDIIGKIIETGYFGRVDAAEILAICEEATKHSQGYLLLPPGSPVHPVGRMWTTDGYLEVARYITIPATYPSVGYAADALLRAVTSSDEE